MKQVFILFCLGVIWQTGLARANLIRKRRRVESLAEAQNYLSKYGYMDGGMTGGMGAALIDEDTMKDGIIQFQRLTGLNQTGELNDETKNMMDVPRCGVKDNAKHHVQKRYVLHGSNWRNPNLKYFTYSYPTTGLQKHEVDETFEEAFNIWAKHCSLTFKKDSRNPDIKIEFQKKDHGDGDPFDGWGGTLAHAFFPVYGGDAHFDDAENFTLKSKAGTNLLQIAVHEFGHSLGLRHSDKRNSIMAPFYRGYVKDLELHSDDIEGIQRLYGEPDESPTVTKKSKNAMCQDPTFDDITRINGDTYVFKGEDCYKLTTDGVALGYPKKISDEFPRVPDNIDAAFSINDGMLTYIFKGEMFWKIARKNVRKGRSVRKINPRVPVGIDGAFFKDGHIYILQNGNVKKCVSSTKKKAQCTNVASGIEPYGVFRDSNDEIYFFGDNDKYYESWVNEKRNFILLYSNYRTTSEKWFGCSKNQHLEISTSEPEWRTSTETVLDSENRTKETGDQRDDEEIEVIDEKNPNDAGLEEATSTERILDQDRGTDATVSLQDDEIEVIEVPNSKHGDDDADPEPEDEISTKRILDRGKGTEETVDQRDDDDIEVIKEPNSNQDDDEAEILA